MSECATTVYSETDSEAREKEREREFVIMPFTLTQFHMLSVEGVENLVLQTF